jgi:hypothetical protein
MPMHIVAVLTAITFVVAYWAGWMCGYAFGRRAPSGAKR